MCHKKLALWQRATLIEEKLLQILTINQSLDGDTMNICRDKRRSGEQERTKINQEHINSRCKLCSFLHSEKAVKTLWEALSRPLTEKFGVFRKQTFKKDKRKVSRRLLVDLDMPT